MVFFQNQKRLKKSTLTPKEKAGKEMTKLKKKKQAMKLAQQRKVYSMSRTIK